MFKRLIIAVMLFSALVLFSQTDYQRIHSKYRIGLYTKLEADEGDSCYVLVDTLYVDTTTVKIYQNGDSLILQDAHQRYNLDQLAGIGSAGYFYWGWQEDGVKVYLSSTTVDTLEFNADRTTTFEVNLDSVPRYKFFIKVDTTVIATIDSVNALISDSVATVITGVTAGTALTGGGTSGTVTLDVVAGTGITTAYDDVGLDITNARNYDWTNETHNFLTTGTASIGNDIYMTVNNKVLYGKNTGGYNFRQLAVGTDNRLHVGASNTYMAGLRLYGGATTYAVQIDNTNLVSIWNGATSAGVLAINEDTDDGSNYASITVPALAANTAYTLPADDGSNEEVLTTNGSGTLDWLPGTPNWYFKDDGVAAHYAHTLIDTLGFLSDTTSELGLSITKGWYKVTFGADTTNTVATKKYVQKYPETPDWYFKDDGVAATYAHALVDTFGVASDTTTELYLNIDDGFYKLTVGVDTTNTIPTKKLMNDSLEVHRTLLDAHTDSLADHRSLLDAHSDSLSHIFPDWGFSDDGLTAVFNNSLIDTLMFKSDTTTELGLTITKGLYELLISADTTNTVATKKTLADTAAAIRADMGGSVETFKTVRLSHSGGTVTAEADQADDTLTLVAGYGLKSNNASDPDTLGFKVSLNYAELYADNVDLCINCAVVDSFYQFKQFESGFSDGDSHTIGIGTSSDYITIASAGYYYVSAFVTFYAATGGSITKLGVIVNEGTTPAAGLKTRTTSDYGEMNMSLGGLANFNSSDRVELFIADDGSQNICIKEATLSVHRLK